MDLCCTANRLQMERGGNFNAPAPTRPIQTKDEGGPGTTTVDRDRPRFYVASQNSRGIAKRIPLQHAQSIFPLPSAEVAAPL